MAKKADSQQRASATNDWRIETIDTFNWEDCESVTSSETYSEDEARMRASEYAKENPFSRVYVVAPDGKKYQCK